MSGCNRVILSILSLTLICSCSVNRALEPRVGAESTPVVVTAGRDDPTNPFALEILDEVNDGANLHLLVRVTPKVDSSEKDVLVRLTSLNSGEVKGVNYFKLGQGSGRDVKLAIQAGKAQKFSLSVPAAQMTDYQLELLWGQEARSAMNTAPKQPDEGRVVLARVEVESDRCQAPCETKFQIVAQLENQTASTLKRATLGLAFVWVGRGEAQDVAKQQDPAPDGEEGLALDNLDLVPGGRREVKLKLSKGVPRTDDGEYRPILRVKDFEFQPQG